MKIHGLKCSVPLEVNTVLEAHKFPLHLFFVFVSVVVSQKKKVHDEFLLLSIHVKMAVK